MKSFAQLSRIQSALNMKFVVAFLALVIQSFALNSIYSKKPEQFIVGGNDARPEQFPYLVSLRWTVDRSHFCGGALVNTRWILTAAHCITANNILSPQEFVNVVGTVSATSDEGSWYETLLWVLHPDWSPAVLRHDIACVETVENMQFGAMIFPIRLTPDRWGGNITAVMAGFGQTQEEPRTDVKQYLEMETLSNADCRRAFDSSPFDAVRVFDSNICLSNPVGRGTCAGDIGGSITVNQISVGVASWVSGGDCASGRPDVYARTSNYYYWIRNVTEINRGEED